MLMCAMMQDLQSQDTSQTYHRLKTCDSMLFNVGFNTCNIRVFEELLSDTFEFYHDQAGITSSKTAFITGIREGLCKLPYKAIRQLEDSTVEVYPLRKNGVLYGAVQTGVHYFYARKTGKEDVRTSTAKFVHVWVLESGEWKLRRSLSFDHQP